MNIIFPTWLHYLSIISVLFGIFSFFIIWTDIKKNPQSMKIMKYVWPINALWSGPLGLLIYYKIGRELKSDHNMDMDMSHMNMSMDNMDMKGMKMGNKPFWQSVISGTFHCGAGCSLADLITPWIFLIFPFTVFNSITLGDWTLAYIFALVIGVAFQYYAISPMLGQTGPKIWIRALKVDFFSLTSWQVGMYGWMAIVIYILYGRISPFNIEFWFMMQIAMACGFVTAYPTNWILIKLGIKSEM